MPTILNREGRKLYSQTNSNDKIVNDIVNNVINNLKTRCKHYNRQRNIYNKNKKSDKLNVIAEEYDLPQICHNSSHKEFKI